MTHTQHGWLLVLAGAFFGVLQWWVACQPGFVWWLHGICSVAGFGVALVVLWFILDEW